MKRSSAPVRLALFAIGAAAVVVLYVFLLSVFRGILGEWSAVLPAAILALAMLVLSARFLRGEGWSFATIGLVPFRGVPVAVGVLSGFLLVGLWALLLTAISDGHWRWTATPSAGGILAMVVFYLLNNLAEELAYRGYAFLLLRRSLGSAVAILLPSVVFALLHIQGGVPWPSAVAVVFPTALLYAVLFLRRRSLLLVWSTHAAMNVAQDVLGLRRSALTLWTFEATRPASATLSLLIVGGVTLVAAGLALTLPPSSPPPPAPLPAAT